ncbi:unnamed protein product [Chrysoparadoxa australica]
MLPLHLWLAEAHVEAPTAASVLLAGLLLKLGTYGLLRFSLVFFPTACMYFTPLVYTFGVLGGVYTSFTALRQTDFKRIIAYTSVAHMSVVLVGIFTLDLKGLEASILQSVSHGFVSSALFFLVGIVYDRYHTRVVKYYGGLVHTMPMFSFIFLFFSLANLGVPGTSNFIGEFLLLISVYGVNTSLAIFYALPVILAGGYSL